MARSIVLKEIPMTKFDLALDKEIPSMVPEVDEAGKQIPILDQNDKPTGEIRMRQDMLRYRAALIMLLRHAKPDGYSFDEMVKIEDIAKALLELKNGDTWIAEEAEHILISKAVKSSKQPFSGPQWIQFIRDITEAQKTSLKATE